MSSIFHLDEDSEDDCEHNTTISQCFHHFLSYGLYTIIKTAYYPYLLVFIGKNEIIGNCDYNALTLKSSFLGLHKLYNSF